MAWFRLVVVLVATFASSAFAGDWPMWRYDSRAVVLLSQDGTTRRMKDFPLPLTVRQAIVTVDPVSGRYLVMTPDRKFHEFDGEKNAYRLIDDFTDTPWPFHRYAAPLVAFIPEYGATMWADRKVILYKHDTPGQLKMHPPDRCKAGICSPPNRPPPRKPTTSILASSTGAPITNARSADGAKYISWKEHRIDDSGLAGVGIGGSDGLAVADLDQDGRMDVVAVHENCQVPIRVSFGGKDPSRWESHTLSPAANEGRDSETVVRGAEDVVIGDVNGDGRLDVVACGEAGAIVYFQAPESPRKTADWKRTAVVKPQAKKNSWIRVDLGDLDGDGRLEILAANKGGTDWVCFQCQGRASDSNSWKRHVIGKTKMPINVRAVDIDRDGDLDALGGSSGEVKIVLLE